MTKTTTAKAETSKPAAKVPEPKAEPKAEVKETKVKAPDTEKVPEGKARAKLIAFSGQAN